MVAQQRSCLAINKNALAQLEQEARATGYWARYNSLKRLLECQDTYAGVLHRTNDHITAQQHAASCWNAWAEDRLEKRRILEESGKWDAAENPFGELVGKNTETREWIEESIVDFDSIYFYLRQKFSIHDEYHNICKSKSLVNLFSTDFSNFIFPCDSYFFDSCFECALFKGARFKQSAGFWNAVFHKEAIFTNAEFEGVAWFNNAVFCAGGRFADARFRQDAWFRDVEFGGNVEFRRTIFGGVAEFWGATFKADAIFGNVCFQRAAEFQGATFEGYAWFHTVHFKGHGWFQLAHFCRPANFREAVFDKLALFSAIKSDQGFWLPKTRFARVPDFSEAAFHAPPVLDEMAIADQLTARRGPFASVPEPEKNGRRKARCFRALGKLAHEARDWGNEMEFFAQEVRCRRFADTFPLGPNAGRFWFGLFYEKLSNYGRSFARPLVAWVASLLGFAVLYSWFAAGGSWWDAFAVSWRQGLVISGLVRTGHYQTLLRRLFDTTPGDGVVDIGNVIFFLLSLQTLLSAFLLFLFFLAVRNHFRIR